MRANQVPYTARLALLMVFVYLSFGGPEETRTLDLSDANRTLSQLSYRPILSRSLECGHIIAHHFKKSNHKIAGIENKLIIVERNMLEEASF